MIFQERSKQEINFYDEPIESSKKMLKRTLPLHIKMKHNMRRNKWLQVERRKLQTQVKELEIEMEMVQIELKKKCLKMILVDEPAGDETTTS